MTDQTIKLQFRAARILCRRGIIFSKSYAQVATPVLPCGVILESGELKFDDESIGKRSSPLTFRASEAQKEIIRRKAWLAGVSVGGFILASVMGSDYRPPKDRDLITELHALNLELTRQGTNLNQIAFLRNGGKASDAEADDMLGIVARSMLKTHQAVRDALAKGQKMPPEP